MGSRERARAAVIVALATALAGLFGALPVGVVAGASAARADLRLEQLAHLDLGRRELSADVWLHRRVAYVGTTVPSRDPERGCPGVGVKVVDLADPARPELVTTVARHPGTMAEVIRVRAVETPAFRGDLLAVGLQPCAFGGLSGLDLWDVTDPREPERLSFFQAAPAGVERQVWGVHELELVQRVDGRVLALLAVPFSESDHPERLGDLRIVEVTDPRVPRALAAWGAQAALGLGSRDGQGRDPKVYGHSARASADGLRAYVSYWDAGVMIFDLADPAAPRLVGRAEFGLGEEGNAHSVDLAHGERVLIQADEVSYAEGRDFGGLRFWDIADPARPRPIGTFHTARSRVDRARGPAAPGEFSAHNPVVRGDLLLVSWFTDGVRVLDIRDAATPREVAAWIPPPRRPERWPMVWGVAVEGDLVVASDIPSGLYVLRLVR
jgi:hypothetical protein